MPIEIPDPEQQFLRDRPSGYDAEEHLRFALYGWQEAKGRLSGISLEVEEARKRAAEKHGRNSIEAIPALDLRWAPVLGEGVGEVMHELTYDSLVDDLSGDPLPPAELRMRRAQRLRAELIDVLAVATAWVDAIDRYRTTPNE